jgi:hypothetical protein
MSGMMALDLDQTGAKQGSVLRSSSLAALTRALAKAQAELKNPPKDRVNPHFRSRYADLATVRDWVLPVLNRHGLGVVQLPCEWEGRLALLTLLLHESGEYLGAYMPLRPVKDDPQGIGSALTYARRYTLQAIVGVAGEEDDDGNAASGQMISGRRASERSGESCRRVFDYFRLRHQIDADQVCKVVGVATPEEIQESHLRRLREIAQALKAGSPVSDFFPQTTSSRTAATAA